MRTLKLIFVSFIAGILVGCIAASSVLTTAATAAVIPAPAWSIQSIAAPTNFTPGDETGLDHYLVNITNSGGEATNRSPIKIIDILPRRLGVGAVTLSIPRSGGEPGGGCKTETNGEVTTVSCEVTEALASVHEPAWLRPGEELLLEIQVKTPTTASGTLVNRVEVQGGGAVSAAVEAENQASEEDAQAGFEEFHAALIGADGSPASAADSHPYEYTTSFATNTEPAPPGAQYPLVPASGSLKEIEVMLPPGLAANPTVVERCSVQQFMTVHGSQSLLNVNYFPNECPASSAVGLAAVQQLEGEGQALLAPIFNLVPPKGMPALLGFQVFGLPVYIDTRVRSDGDYGVTAYLSNVTEAKRITAARITVWGTPWDASHDTLRGQCAELEGSCPVVGVPRPFMRLPSQCVDPLLTSMSFSTWAQPPTGASTGFEEAAPTDCAAPPFTPSIEAKPTSAVADSSAGLHFDLHVPQREHEDPEGLGEADLRDVSVTLPAGLVANPAQADGLAACSPAQVGLTTPVGQSNPIHFNLAAVQCPDASKLGTVEAVVPAVNHPLKGSVYLAAQDDNPFNSLVALYIVFEDEQTGIVVKLAARVTLDPVSGQLTTAVTENPQVPFEDFKFDFFEGSRAPLRTPATCGTYTTTTSMIPWSSPEGPSAAPSDVFQIVSAPGGAPCVGSEAQAPNAPAFEAGTASPVAGSYSPFVLKLSREDGSQRFSGLGVTLPPGLIGKIAGLQQCSQAAIESALARSREGDGMVELAHPSCPVGSEVGTVHVGAGSGAPLYVTGRAYFAGPYKGAPFSLVIVTPAVAGPFDLGVVVVRAALYIDPSSAQVTVRSDPFPTILDGIPLDVRSVNVDVSRPEFTLNPTSCSVMSVTGQEVSTTGQTAGLSDRFQAGGCTTLPFRPLFAASSSAKTSRSEGASLSVHVSSGVGQANIARVRVSLPKQLPSRLDTLKLACRESVFAADPGSCPQGSVVGMAVAHTPILNVPLSGPAYIVSHGGAAFPDLEVVLQGEGVTIVLDGKTDIKGGITTSTFESVPDAPVSSFELNLPKGPHSILGAPSGLCLTRTVLVKRKVTVRVKLHGRVQKRRVTRKVKQTLAGGTLVMPTMIQGQNGAVIKQSTPINVIGCVTSVKHKAKGNSGRRK